MRARRRTARVTPAAPRRRAPPGRARPPHPSARTRVGQRFPPCRHAHAGRRPDESRLPARSPSVTTQRIIGTPGCPGAVPEGSADRYGGPPGREPAPDAAGGRTLGARGRLQTAPADEVSFQSKRSDGGARGAGTSVGNPRCLRIFRITTGSSMVATSLRRNPTRWGTPVRLQGQSFKYWRKARRDGSRPGNPQRLGPRAASAKRPLCQATWM